MRIDRDTRSALAARLPPLMGLLIAALLVSACTERAPEIELSCEASGVREVVERLGERLKLVPLLAPEPLLVEEIRSVFAPLVTPDLLDEWIAQPSQAPGRAGSSPWPERIEIGAVETVEPGHCRVEAEVIYLTSVELARGGVAMREPLIVHLSANRDWRVSSYEALESNAP